MIKDFVCVQKGLEKDFIEMAESLGYTDLVLIYTYKEAKTTPKQYFDTLKQTTSLHLLFGVFVDKVGLHIPHFDIHIGLGTKITSVSKGLDYLCLLEFSPQKDGLHQRRSGINHVVLAECAQKNITILFGFSDLFDDKNKEVVLGRAMQNKKLCTKKNVDYVVCSLAKKPLDMRHYRDVGAFTQILS